MFKHDSKHRSFIRLVILGVVSLYLYFSIDLIKFLVSAYFYSSDFWYDLIFEITYVFNISSLAFSLISSFLTALIYRAIATTRLYNKISKGKAVKILNVVLFIGILMLTSFGLIITLVLITLGDSRCIFDLGQCLE